MKNGLFKASEAADYLAVSRRTLWELTHRKGLPYIRIGRSVRYREQDLANWVGQRASVQVDEKKGTENDGE